MTTSYNTEYEFYNGRAMSKERYRYLVSRLDMSSGLTDEILDKLFEEHGFLMEIA